MSNYKPGDKVILFSRELPVVGEVISYIECERVAMVKFWKPLDETERDAGICGEEHRTVQDHLILGHFHGLKDSPDTGCIKCGGQCVKGECVTCDERKLPCRACAGSGAAKSAHYGGLTECEDCGGTGKAEG